ncbi:thioredoxin domain-containing protein [Streptomyces sp. NPDC005951]|uniref:thioredoxin family protein n=1 Tax=Streptomyces sp. NPDC005951 TaxID=3154573 RepID=UPI0033CD5C2F
MLGHFWAEWAGPSKMMRPILADLAQEHAGRLTIAELNIDQNPETAPRYDISGVSAFLLFKEGVEIGRRIGAWSKGQLEEFVDVRL